MNAARRIGILSFFLGILTRLYLLSGVAVVVVLLGNILGLLSSATYAHQALGAMIVTGGIWFLALAINSIMSGERGHQAEFALFSESSIGASSTSPEPQVPLERSVEQLAPAETPVVHRQTNEQGT